MGTPIGAFLMGLHANGSDLPGISPYMQRARLAADVRTEVRPEKIMNDFKP